MNQKRNRSKGHSLKPGRKPGFKLPKGRVNDGAQKIYGNGKEKNGQNNNEWVKDIGFIINKGKRPKKKQKGLPEYVCIY